MSVELPDRSRLPDDIEQLKDLLLQAFARLDTVTRDAAQSIERLELRIAALSRKVFGVRSEQHAAQGELFDQTTALPIPPEARERVSYERRRGGRPALAADLPRVRVEYDLEPAEKAAFAAVQHIGEERTQTLEFTPARLTVIEHARLKYRCQYADGTSTIRTAWAAPSPLPKSNAGAGLLAHVLVAKYADALPLARIERMFARHGAKLSRKTLCDWVMRACELLGALREPLKAHILGAPVVFSDDTTLKLIAEQARAGTVTARLWAYISAGATRQSETSWLAYPRAALYEFTTDRRGAHPCAFLARYRGYLQADDYAGYHALFRSRRVYHAACWSHARRKFFEIAHAAKTRTLAHDALDWIGKLYEIEADIRGRPPNERQCERGRRTRALLATFLAWLRGIEPALLPQGAMAVAVRYVLSNWRALTRFTRVGILEADTNLVERGMRTVAVGRKNWLYVGAERGGHAAATILSLIETCKLNQVNPYDYLRDVLARIGQHRTDRLAELLPFNWRPLSAG